MVKKAKNETVKWILLPIVITLFIISIVFTARSFLLDNNLTNKDDPWCDNMNWIWSGELKDNESREQNIKNFLLWSKSGDMCQTSYSENKWNSWWSQWIIQKNKWFSTDEILKYEIIKVWHDEFSIIPEKVYLKSNKSYKLIITPSKDWGWCMDTLTIPKIDENIYKIKKNIPITITIDHAKPWTYKIVCWSMWMYQWRIIIE